MAINVNTVYQTVLLILNKEQRGYMTPLEFNKIGTQSQLEIFETYFDSLNQQIRIPQTNTDYADRVVSLDEKISIFKTTGSCVYADGQFSLPAQYSGAITIGEGINATANTSVYTLTTITAAQVAAGVSSVFIGADAENAIEIASSAYTLSGTTLTLATATSGSGNQAFIQIQVTPKQFYRLGVVTHQSGALPFHELQRVDKGELYHLLSSNLTKPSKSYPIYTYENNKLTVYPNDSVTGIISGLQANYIRKPLNPLWFFTGGTTQYIYQASASQNFELHACEQTELILKILLYAGVVIKSPEIVQVAANQVALENINQQR
tara:strand:- start:2388 stop:3350 length:963 start_codon:yes stop_codon:yes gene_type:complete